MSLASLICLIGAARSSATKVPRRLSGKARSRAGGSDCARVGVKVRRWRATKVTALESDRQSGTNGQPRERKEIGRGSDGLSPKVPGGPGGATTLASLVRTRIRSCRRKYSRRARDRQAGQGPRVAGASRHIPCAVNWLLVKFPDRSADTPTNRWPT